MKNYMNTGERAVKNDYPYGRLRTTVTFGLDFNPKHGFRTTFQSINPKNLRINAVKTSTYSDLTLMYLEPGTGHVKYDSWDLNGEDAINSVAKVAGVNFDKFTIEQTQWLYGRTLVALKATAQAMVTYCGANVEEVLNVLRPAMAAAVNGYKTGENVWDKIAVDVEALNKCRVPGYQPFKVTYHGPISLTGGTAL